MLCLKRSFEILAMPGTILSINGKADKYNPVGRGRGGKSAKEYLYDLCDSFRYKATTKGDSAHHPKAHSFLLKLLRLHIHVPLVACSLGHNHLFRNHRHSNFPG